jgi:glutathione S-transferase
VKAPDNGMKLYQGDGPNSYRVRIFLAEKEIDLPRVQVRLERGEHRTPQFLKLNSLGQVPVLVLGDGSVITESIAICRYFEEIHLRPALFGADATEKARIEMWNRRMEIEVFGTIGNVALHSDELFKGRLVQFPAFAETQRNAMPKKWEWLDRELNDGRAFLAGDHFSIADITGAVAAWLGDFFGMQIPTHLENVHRWSQRVRERPGWNA